MSRIGTVWLLLLATGCALAQIPGPGGPPPDGPDGPMMGSNAPQPLSGTNAHKFLARLNKDLKLTDDQKAKIKPILDTEQQQFDALRKSSTPREEQFQKITTIEQDSWSQIRDLLTTAQQKKFDALTKKIAASQARAASRQENDDDGLPPPPSGGPPPGGAPPGGPPD